MTGAGVGTEVFVAVAVGVAVGGAGVEVGVGVFCRVEDTVKVKLLSTGPAVLVGIAVGC